MRLGLRDNVMILNKVGKERHDWISRISYTPLFILLLCECRCVDYNVNMITMQESQESLHCTHQMCHVHSTTCERERKCIRANMYLQICTYALTRANTPAIHMFFYEYIHTLNKHATLPHYVFDGDFILPTLKSVLACGMQGRLPRLVSTAQVCSNVVCAWDFFFLEDVFFTYAHNTFLDFTSDDRK